MKYVFFALLLANAAYLVYAELRDDATSPEASRPTYPEGTDTIYLLSENAKGIDTRERELSMTINNPVRPGEDPEGGCLALGPFGNLFGGKAVADQLAALDMDVDLRAVDHETGENDYRVMIPPASSLQDAFRKLRELKSRNIDSYVITQGKEALAISLGVFSTRNAAENAQRQRSRDGYEAAIVEIPRLRREFWVFPSTGNNLVLPQGLWNSLLAANSGLEQRTMSCPAPGPSG